MQILSLVVVVVLLIACTNVAVLTVSREDRRSREIATRLALGASRGRIVQQLLIESALLSLLAAAASIAVAFGLHRLLIGLAPFDPSAAVAFQLDCHMLGFLLFASALAGLLSGLMPALRLTALDPHPVLKGEEGALGRRRPRVARRILVSQVAGTLVLLAGAGLFLRSLLNLVGVDTGFDRRDLVVVRMAPVDRQATSAQGGARVKRLVERVRALPGVEAVAAGLRPIFATRHRHIISVWVDGAREERKVAFNAVDPSFFAAVGLPLLAGRGFDERDDEVAPRVAVVTEAFVRRYIADKEPLGRRLSWSNEESIEVVGIAADAKVWSLRGDAKPVVYLPIAQEEGVGPLSLHVRLHPRRHRQAPAVLREVAGADPTLEIVRAATLEETLRGSLREERLFATLTAVFAAIALALTAVGLYGTMAFAAARRTREIGIRMALGANRGQVVRMMLGEAAVVIAAGLVVGLLLAAVAIPSLRGLLFGLGPWDPVTFLAAACL